MLHFVAPCVAPWIAILYKRASRCSTVAPCTPWKTPCITFTLTLTPTLNPSPSSCPYLFAFACTSLLHQSAVIRTYPRYEILIPAQSHLPVKSGFVGCLRL